MTHTAIAADEPDPQLQPTVTLDSWRCYQCGATFVHARYLAGHLLDYHGEAR